MKTPEELNALKEEAVIADLQVLTEEELGIVNGGSCPEEHNVMLTGDFNGNHANGSGSGIYNE